jgi:hypothetical protein
MRFALGLLAVLVAPSSLFAQSDIVRGCVTLHAQGVVLRALDARRQHFDSQNLVDGGEPLLLVADDDLLEEIVLLEGQEIEVTGRINPAPARPIAAAAHPAAAGRRQLPRRGQARRREARRREAVCPSSVDSKGTARPGCRGRDRGRGVQGLPTGVPPVRSFLTRTPCAGALRAMTLDRSVAADDDRINRLVLAAHPDVQAVYRYGTWGTAAERPDSDVDIAVLLPHGPAMRVDRWQWHLLAVDIAGAVCAEHADLINLRRADTSFQAEILRTARLTYSGQDDERLSFESLVLSMYQKLNAERDGIRAAIVGNLRPPSR